MKHLFIFCWGIFFFLGLQSPAIGSSNSGRSFPAQTAIYSADSTVQLKPPRRGTGKFPAMISLLLGIASVFAPLAGVKGAVFILGGLAILTGLIGVSRARKSATNKAKSSSGPQASTDEEKMSILGTVLGVLAAVITFLVGILSYSQS